ncbi:hypothetical protein pkur_cds_710 [Pandoravirus kuranda]|uniref:Uncharacterized protein n=1 Tax=Pandoravirus kuranda TaxID=3019033 RepID=A0AA95EEB3_9VIRU|nr:hypothetical protein pkur_cds_710 [Pandoravirus kuranda]
MSAPVAQQIAHAPVAVVAPATAAPQVVAPVRRGVPWGWIIAGVALALLLALVVSVIVYESRNRRPPTTNPFLPIAPAGTPRTVAAPLGRPLAAGRYKIRWGPTGLYMGVNQGQTNPATLVAATAAPTWTYAPSASGIIGGTLTSSTGSTLSTGNATALVGPVPVFVAGGTPSQTGSWLPAASPGSAGFAGTTHATNMTGTIYNASLGGCLRPDGAGVVGSPIVLAPSCGATESGWVFEPAAA